MKLFLAVCLLVLVAGSNCQQMYTLENCLYAYGLVTADLALVNKDKRNAQYIAKAKSDITTLNNVCTAVIKGLPNLGEAPETQSVVGCEKLLEDYKIAVKVSPSKAYNMLQKYHVCITRAKVIA